jgi:polyhydroxyalkanoate synthesis regulator phasin
MTEHDLSILKKLADSGSLTTDDQKFVVESLRAEIQRRADLEVAVNDIHRQLKEILGDRKR